MTYSHYQTALIVGAGSGLSAALARALAKEGIKVALAARQAEKLAMLANETGAHSFSCEATDRAHVDRLFADVEATMAAPEIVIYNAGYRARGPFCEIDPIDVEKALAAAVRGEFQDHCVSFQRVASELLAGFDKGLLVESYAAAEPTGVGVGADHREKALDLMHLGLSGQADIDLILL